MRISSITSRAFNINIFQNKSLKSAAYNNAVNTVQYETLKQGYYLPLSFAGRTYSTDRPELGETPSHFKITNFDNISCPACGSKMMPRDKFYEFKEKTDNSEPDKYLDVIGDYKKYMRPVELSVYEEISKLSDETGEKDLQTLVKMLRDTKLVQLQKIQMERVKEMNKLARSLPQQEKEILTAKLKQLEQQIRKKNSEAPFRRKIMIENISKIALHNPKHQEKLLNIAHSFPTSKDLNSAWIVKYSGNDKHGKPWESKDIALRMLSESISNTDHILAYSLEKNHDDISNYMAMHRGCNVQKSNKSLKQWIDEDKKSRLNNINQYFQDVGTLIDEDFISDEKYKNYVTEAKQTINKITDGQICI